MSYHILKQSCINSFCSKSVWQTRALSSNNVLRSLKIPEDVIPKNLLEKYTIDTEQPNGKVYDTKPFKIKLMKDTKYYWCSCGHSKSQPLCDGSHKIYNLKITHKPVVFQVEQTKHYWLCNCKASKHKPFCDGSHIPLRNKTEKKK